MKRGMWLVLLLMVPSWAWGGGLSQWLVQLRSKQVEQRRAAARSIAGLGMRGIPGLLKVLEDPVWGVRKVAVEAFKKLGVRALPRLQKALFHKHPRVRLEVGRVIGALGPKAAPAEGALKRALGDREWGVRYAVADALSKLHRRTAIPALFRCLRDPYWRVRAAGARGLGHFVDGVKVVRGYLRKATTDKHEAVRYAAARGLRRLPKNAGSARAWVPLFVGLMSDASWRVRWVGADTLGRWGRHAKAAVPALRKAFADKKRKIQPWAALSLGSIGRPARAVIPKFVKMLEADDAMHVAMRNMWSPLGRMNAALRLRKRLPYLKLLFAVTRSLARFGPLARPRIEQSLRRSPRVPNPWLVFTLGCMGAKAKKSRALLLGWKDHSQTEIRFMILLVLSRIAPKHPSVRRALWRGRKDRHSYVRLAAAQGLAELRDPRFLRSKAYARLRADRSRVRLGAKNFLLLMKSQSLQPSFLWK